MDRYKTEKTSSKKGRGHYMSNDNPTVDINPLIVFHQNICGLQKKKVDELISSVLPDQPHIMCLTEYQLKQPKLDQINMDGYRLATSYCRKLREKGGVCILVHKNLNYSKIDQSRFCKYQDLVVCALKLEFTVNIYILAIYRVPSGNFISFFNEIDKTINSLYKAGSKLIICGDINIDYQTDNDKRKQLDAVLQTYNLTSIVHFPTRIQNNLAQQ
jgi:exonuclease III